MNIEAQPIRELAVQEITTKTDTRDILAHATKSFRDKRLDGWTLIDVDAHHSEMSSWSEIVENLDDPILLHHAREFRSRTGGAPGLSNHMPGIRYQDVGGRIRHQQKLDEPVDDKSVHRDVTLVRRSIEALGLDYQVLFPGNMLALGTHPQQRVEAELAVAYNRWLCDHVLDKDDRIKSLLYLPLGEPEYCLRIIKELAERKSVHRLHGHERALRSRCTQFLHPDLPRAERARAAACLPCRPALARRIHEADRRVHVDARDLVRAVQHGAPHQLDRARPAGALPQAQDHLDRVRARLASVHDAAARQQLHDATHPRRRCSRSCRATTCARCSSPASRWRHPTWS